MKGLVTSPCYVCLTMTPIVSTDIHRIMGLVTSPHSVGLVEENCLCFWQTEMLPFKGICLLYGVTSGLWNCVWL